MNQPRSTRKGTVTLEAAIIFPVMMLIILAAIDVGQYVNCTQIVSHASREGGRVASRNDTAYVSEVENAVLTFLENAFPNHLATEIDQATTIELRDSAGTILTGNDLNYVGSGNPIYVRVHFDFNDVRWLGGLELPYAKEKTTTTVCRRE